ncbi:unnamed protein product, partial [Iphiclides podalirius]
MALSTRQDSSTVNAVMSAVIYSGGGRPRPCTPEGWRAPKANGASRGGGEPSTVRRQVARANNTINTSLSQIGSSHRGAIYSWAPRICLTPLPFIIDT